MSNPAPSDPSTQPPVPNNGEQLKPFRIQLAERINRLPQYVLARVNALLHQKRKEGQDVVDLGMGNPSEPPQDVVIEKLMEAARDPDNHGYSKANGILNLRREVAAKYYKKFGVRLDPDSEVIVTIGSKEGFSHMCLAAMGAGETAIIPAPYFPAHMYAIVMASGNVITHEVSDSEKFISNVAFTCQNMTPRPKLLVINYPHNPSSKTVEPEFFVEVVKLARRYGFMVISDFAYADVAFDGYQPPSFLAAPGAKDVGVEFTTMSKGYNMAGWRVGFAAGNRELVGALGKVKTNVDSGVFEAVQRAAIAALSGDQECVEEMRRVYRVRRDVLCGGLSRAGFDVLTPSASFYCLVAVPDGVTALAYATQILAETGVVVTPATGFGAGGEGYVRLTLCADQAHLAEAVRRLASLHPSR
jgi:alanine-synthesizing transaminase